MKCITFRSRALAVSAAVLATAIVAAVFPLLAFAGDGGPAGF